MLPDVFDAALVTASMRGLADGEFVIVKLRWTGGAAAWVELPAWDAMMSQKPMATIVTLLPLTVQMD